MSVAGTGVSPDDFSFLEPRNLNEAISHYAKRTDITRGAVGECVARAINGLLGEAGFSLVFDGSGFVVRQDEGGECPYDSDSVIAQIDNIHDFQYHFFRSLEEHLRESRYNRKLTEVKNKIGKLIDVTVIKISNKLVIGHYHDLEIVISQKDMVKHDRIKLGQTVKVLLTRATFTSGEFRIEATRSGKDFLYELVSEYVPELGEGNINIDYLVRNEGLKSFVVVSSATVNNPSRFFLGVRGSRIVAMKRHLPERLDVVEFSKQPETFLPRLFRNNLLRSEQDASRKYLRLSLRDLGSPTFPALEVQLLGQMQEFSDYTVDYELVPEEDNEGG